MKKQLLDVIFASDKRKNVLLLLQNGPQEMDALLNSLDTKRQALLPQMKILEEHHFVSHNGDTYELTIIGKLIVEMMLPILKKIDVLDIDIGYWGNHDFDFIPSDLLERIGELRNYEIINPPLIELYEIHKTYHELKISEYVYTAGNIVYPNYQSRFTEMIGNNITIYYIVSEDLFNKIRTESYEHLKFFLESGYFNLYVYHKKMNFLFFTFDDYHLVMNPLKKDGNVDNKYLICNTEDALDWGKELFDYYLRDSTQITKV